MLCQVTTYSIRLLNISPQDPKQFFRRIFDKFVLSTIINISGMTSVLSTCSQKYITIQRNVKLDILNRQQIKSWPDVRVFCRKITMFISFYENVNVRNASIHFIQTCYSFTTQYLLRPQKRISGKCMRAQLQMQTKHVVFLVNQWLLSIRIL